MACGALGVTCAERAFDVLAFAAEPPGAMSDGGPILVSVGSGRIGTVRTRFGSPIAMVGGAAADEFDAEGGKFGAIAVAH
jgi:hypothetical protein